MVQAFSCTDYGTKINVIRSNPHKYYVSSMCKVLKIPRSTYYSKSVQTKNESELVNHIIDIFKSSKNNYGTRKIKVILSKGKHQVSSRRIGYNSGSNKNEPLYY